MYWTYMAPLSKWSTACGAARAWRRRFAHSLRGLWRGAGTSGDLRRGVPECMQPRMTARPLAMRSSWFLASCCSGPYDCLNVLIRFDCTCTRLRHRRAGPCPTWSSGTFAGWPAKRSLRRKCKRACGRILLPGFIARLRNSNSYCARRPMCAGRPCADSTNQYPPRCTRLSST